MTALYVWDASWEYLTATIHAPDVELLFSSVSHVFQVDTLLVLQVKELLCLCNAQLPYHG